MPIYITPHVKLEIESYEKAEGLARKRGLTVEALLSLLLTRAIDRGELLLPNNLQES